MESYAQIVLDRAILVGIATLAAFAAGLFTLVFLYLLIIYTRFKKREHISMEMVTYEVRLPKDNEIKIDAAEQMFASFSSIKKHGNFEFLEVEDVLAFEIVGKKGDIRFYVSAPNRLADLVQKTIYSYYPVAEFNKVDDPNIFTQNGNVVYSCLANKETPYKPFKTYKDLPTDSLSAITSALSKMDDDEGVILQFLIRPARTPWKKEGKAYVARMKKQESSPDKATYKVDTKMLEKIEEKCSKPAFEAMIRFVVSSPNKESAKSQLRNISSAFAQFNSDLNSLDKPKIIFKGGFMINFIYRFFPIFEWPNAKVISTFSSEELASFFHFPNKTIETPNINWLKSRKASISSEIPTSGDTFLGYGEYRGERRPVYMNFKDRMRHMYVIGKTGTGKSELLIELIRQDIKAGHGVCVIDPHGDLIDDIMCFIPPERAEDVVVFDPSDTERPIGFNMLEWKTEEEKHFITTAIINLMYKLYDPQRTGIIGPQFEHAVRNAMLTVMCEPGASFVEVMRILTDDKYMQEVLPKVQDPVVRRYWTDQIAKTNEFHKSETLGYITSKFGRFVTNTMIRNIIGQSKSGFDIRHIMDNRQILLVNLSKGKLGEENSQFLGLLFVPKILAAAMSRVDIPQDERKEFMFYVDEFQNFATPDFAVILSEARKYKLALTVANQFIGQMDEEVKNAVFGNVGTKMIMRVGVTDASFLARELQPTFNETDIINQERFHAYTQTIVNNEPVPAFSLDLTKDYAKYSADKKAGEEIAKAVIQLSRLKYGRPRELVNAEIIERARL